MTLQSRFRWWLADPATQSSHQRPSLDRYGSSILSKHPSQPEETKDLESQNSNPSSVGQAAENPGDTSNLSIANVTYAARPSRSILARAKAWKPSKEIIYNAILGTSDGMTVPFAVTASLAGVADTKLVMLAGLSELIAGAVSMGAGGILGARTDVKKYIVARQKVQARLQCHPADATTFITDTFTPYLTPSLTSSLCTHVTALAPEERLDFLMRFTPIYHDPSPPTTSGAWKIALVLGTGYFSGLLPLIPYMAVPRKRVNEALYISIGVTAVLLAIFGYGKTAITVGRGRFWECVRGALECLLVVGVSAGLSVIIIRGIGGSL
ncbi:MAG: hypothetical protein Q9163_000997 [Psora crenata]